MGHLLKWFLSFAFVVSFAHSANSLFNSRSIAELNSKLNKREFHGVVGARYESSIWSAVAALETRAYPWSRYWWRKIDLKWPKNSAHAPYYQGDVPAYYYEKKGDKLLIIFGTSFGNVGGGTWYRKFINQLRATHPDASVLIFPGYLSTENLKSARPPFADAGVRFVAFDYLHRIEEFLSQRAAKGKVYRKVGSMGLSGGASLVLRILQTNRRFVGQKDWYPFMFNWGNIAFSPVMSAIAAAEAVDAQADHLEEHNRVELDFSIEDWLVQKILKSVFRFSKKVNAKYMLELTKEPEHPSYEEVQNLVAYSVIHELAKFSKRQSPDYRGPLRLKEYYQDYSYPHLKKIYGSSIPMSYETFSSFDDAAKESRGPLRLVFAEDDPILSINGLKNPEMRANPRVMRVVRAYQKNPHTRVDLMRFGGHLAYIADSQYVAQIFAETFR